MLEIKDYFLSDIYSLKIDFKQIYEYYKIYNYIIITNQELRDKFKKKY